MRSIQSKRYVLILANCLLFVFAVYPQASSPYIPNIIPPSPNAATLSKFTDVPVSPYTGTADITVPIYTVQARGLSIPIGLDYHTGGIRMKEESGWVGLGWALSAGGAISRTIMDHDDFNSGANYFTPDVPQLQGDMSSIQYPQYKFAPPLGDYMFDFWCSYKVNVTGGTEDYYNAFTIGKGVYDIEPDIYTYNFPGHSGKFIILRNRQVVLQQQDNIRIQVDNAGNAFTVTDEQGNNFVFQDRDSTESATGANSTYSTSSWNLSRIVTQLNDSVTFNYTSDNTWTYVAPEIYETYNVYCTNQGYTRGNPAGTLYLNKTLQSINFSDGQLQFVFDGNRSDLSGGKKLDAVKVYSKTGSSYNYLKEHDFYYSYFDAIGEYPASDTLECKRLRLDSVKEVSGSYSTPPYSFAYFGPPNTKPFTDYEKHGYSVDDWGYYNGVSNTTYIPNATYQYAPWNGGPEPVFYTYTGQGTGSSAANRAPDPTALSTQLFALQQVNYPTGGRTVLAYAQNDYNDSASRTTSSTDFPQYTLTTVLKDINISAPGTSSGTISLSGIYPLVPAGSPTTNFTLDVAFMGTGNDSINYHNLAPDKIYFTFTVAGEFVFSQDITGSNLNCSGSVCSISMPLTITGSPTSGTWTAYIDPSVNQRYFSEILVQYSFQEYLTAYNNNPTLTASGLRINTITDYSAASTIAKQRTYTYGYTQGGYTPQYYSYGKLMSYPSYARYGSLITGGGPDNGSYCTFLSLYGSSYVPLTSVIRGNIVGYDQVTESTVDPQTGQDIGRTVYKYFNSPDTGIGYAGYRLPGTLNIGNNLDGSLLSKTVYANVGGNYQPVTSTVNSYHTTNRSIYYSPKYWYSTYAAAASTATGVLVCPVDTGVSNETYACFYPSIKSERVLLDSTYDYQYDQSNPANYVLTIKRNYYDNPVHYLPTRNNTTDSKGNSLTTHLKYPQDYIPTGQTATGNTILDSMIGRNIVAEAIEKQDSLYYSGSSAGYITGAQLSLFRILSSNLNTVVPDKIYKLGIQSPITNFTPFSISGNTTNVDSRNRLMASFDQYDTRNNLQQYTTTDLNPVSIIWDYVGKYPVAQAKNAVITDVAATSFEADGYGNWSPFTGAITTITAAPFPPTGNRYYNLTTSATLSKSGLVSGNTYIVSYWSLNGAYSISGGTGSSISGKTINGWTYYEHTVTASATTLTISGTGSIDEVRLYPATAQMTTYTFSPLKGMTTQCDVDNRVTYYFYDGLGRLMYVKDQDGNIIKTYQYHYLNSTTQY
jgi:hypothetical protein